MRLRTTIAASVLALGAVLGGAGSALAHDDCDHDNGRHHNYNRDHDYGRHNDSYGRDNDNGRHSNSYGRDNDYGRHHSYGRDHGKSHECHTAMGSSANRGSFYENDCKSDNDRGDRHHY
ncbi:hypothetical protein [Streptomyces sp. CBMA152]|uniref:hypothetical protein n=1 Tax=Streptomyces sp. CBMA152 TaxID=1896312 RepID=UPI0016607206|nr:hypothetical protein [Streptomyces sp. CBMA152]MBD0741055.1 hypothetical protein [Streptomyces sp. CBMA152]